MFSLLPINWSSAFLFLVLALLGLWAAFSFMNKNGLYLFSIISVMLIFVLPDAWFFNQNLWVSMGAIFMPLVYFSLIVVCEKYKKTDAQRLFYVLLATMGIIFICNFFISAYVDSELGGSNFLSWNYLGKFVSSIIAFAVATISVNAFMDKFPISKEQKYLRRAVLVSIACVIDSSIFTFLSYIGVHSFGNIMLIWLIRLFFVVGISFAVAFLRKFLNRQPIATIEENEEQKAKQQKELDEKLKTSNGEDSQAEVVEIEVETEDKDTEE